MKSDNIRLIGQCDSKNHPKNYNAIFTQYTTIQLNHNQFRIECYEYGRKKIETQLSWCEEGDIERERKNKKSKPYWKRNHKNENYNWDFTTTNLCTLYPNEVLEFLVLITINAVLKLHILGWSDFYEATQRDLYIYIK